MIHIENSFITALGRDYYGRVRHGIAPLTAFSQLEDEINNNNYGTFQRVQGDISDPRNGNSDEHQQRIERAFAMLRSLAEFDTARYDVDNFLDISFLNFYQIGIEC